MISGCMWLAVPAAFLISLGSTGVLSHVAGRWRLLDVPNERSLHGRPVPRVGGLGIASGILCAGLIGWLVCSQQLMPAAMLVSWSLVVAVSLGDDRWGLPAALRLTVHLLAAVCFTLFVVPASYLVSPFAPAWIVFPLLVLTVAWMLNLYNFMDGMDGLAATMAITGFGTLAVTGVLEGDQAYAASACVVAAASAGFLRFNLPPARVFMGDAGSAGLGFLAGAFSVWGSVRGTVPLWGGVAAFAPFVLDATLTLLRRFLQGKPVWQAHREHGYQRLVLAAGGRHGPVLAAAAAVMLLNGLFVIMTIESHTILRRNLGFASLGFLYMVLFFVIGQGLPSRHKSRET